MTRRLVIDGPWRDDQAPDPAAEALAIVRLLREHLTLELFQEVELLDIHLTGPSAQAFYDRVQALK